MTLLEDMDFLMRIAKSSTSVWITGQGGTRELQNNTDHFQVVFCLQVVLKTLLLKTPHTWDAGPKEIKLKLT